MTPNALRRARNAANLTHAQLAARCNERHPMQSFSAGYISRIERRGWCWEWDHDALIAAMGVHGCDLFDQEQGGDCRLVIRD